MLNGHVDVLNAREVAGWVRDATRPEAAVSVLVLDNDKLVGRVVANRYRADLSRAGIGEGRHGFVFEFPLPLNPAERHAIRLRSEVDGEEFPPSPLILEPSRSFDTSLQELVSSILAQCGQEEDIPRKIEFLATELDRLMQRLAEHDSNQAARVQYRRLRERWVRSPGAERAFQAAEIAPAPARRILVIDDRFPRADRDAGSNAILSHMQSLKRLGFEVTFVASGDFAADERDRSALEAVGLHYCSAPFYGSVEEVLRRQTGEFDAVYFHRVANAVKYGELAQQHQPRARRIFSVADLHHLRLSRQAEVERRPDLKPVASRTRFLEIFAAAATDAVITHSSYEAELLRRQVWPAKVHLVRWTVAPQPTAVPFRDRRGIAFIGGFGHEPNRDAVRWLVSEIMPLIRAENPAIECLIVGSGLEAHQRLSGDGVVVLGQVPSLAEVFDRVRLTVAPIAFGAGIKGKVLDSMAAGVPCVATPVAAEGLDLPEMLRVLVAESPTAIAATVCRLHEDEALNAACGAAGLDYVASHLSETRIDEEMRGALGLARNAAAKAPPSPAILLSRTGETEVALPS